MAVDMGVHINHTVRNNAVFLCLYAWVWHYVRPVWRCFVVYSLWRVAGHLLMRTLSCSRRARTGDRPIRLPEYYWGHSTLPLINYISIELLRNTTTNQERRLSLRFAFLSQMDHTNTAKLSRTSVLIGLREPCYPRLSHIGLNYTLLVYIDGDISHSVYICASDPLPDKQCPEWSIRFMYPLMYRAIIWRLVRNFYSLRSLVRQNARVQKPHGGESSHYL